MAPRTLDEILKPFWSKRLRAAGLTEVDEHTLNRIIQASAPDIRAAAERGRPDYDRAAATRQRIRQILFDAGYQLPRKGHELPGL